MAIIESLPSTDQITDPQTRHFCDALLNAWQLRNGVTGDGMQRFITAEEWNVLAGNPVINALAGLSNPGSNTVLPGPGGGDGLPGPPGQGAVLPITHGNLPPSVAGLLTLLTTPLTVNDFAHIRENANEIWAGIKAAEQLVKDAAIEGSTTLDDAINNALLQDQIDQINYVDGSSTSHSAQQVSGIRLTVEDPTNGLAAAHSSIIEINTVTATSTSASAQYLHGLQAKVDDPQTGLAKATADIVQVNTVSATSTSANARTLATMSATAGGSAAAIVQINTVSADSTSANAQQLAGLTAQVNNPATGLPAASAAIVAINTISTTSNSASARKVAGIDATVYGPNGVAAHTAQIGEINNVSATSTSANARQLASVQAFSHFKGRTFVQTTAPVSTFSPPLPAGQEYALSINDLWIDSSAGNILKRWTGSAWVDSGDARISGSGAGVTTEAGARSEADLALAGAINSIWGFVGNNNALVQTGGKIEVNPLVGTAEHWTFLQTATFNANGESYVSLLDERYTSFSNAEKQKAKSSYVMRVQAEGNGAQSIAGMSLYSEVDQGVPLSHIIFNADEFYIFNDSPGLTIPASKVAPFAIINGIVRQNISYITDHIRSDSYSPGVSGWKISSNGNAEFNGIVTSGSIRSGSKLIDRDSGYQLLSVAQAYHFGSYSGANIFTSADLRFEGPNYHQGTPISRRVRTSNVGGALIVTVILNAEVDHYMTLWFRGWDRPSWYPAATIVAGADNYGLGSITWGSGFGMSVGGWFEFGFSPTTGSMAYENAAKLDMRNVNCIVQFCNL